MKFLNLTKVIMSALSYVLRFFFWGQNVFLSRSFWLKRQAHSLESKYSSSLIRLIASITRKKISVEWLWMTEACASTKKNFNTQIDFAILRFKLIFKREIAEKFTFLNFEKISCVVVITWTWALQLISALTFE